MEVKTVHGEPDQQGGKMVGKPVCKWAGLVWNDAVSAVHSNKKSEYDRSEESPPSGSHWLHTHLRDQNAQANEDHETRPQNSYEMKHITKINHRYLSDLRPSMLFRRIIIKIGSYLNSDPKNSAGSKTDLAIFRSDPF